MVPLIPLGAKVSLLDTLNFLREPSLQAQQVVEVDKN
jgi:hypothetical protein